MEEEPAQQKKKTGRRTGPGEEETWKKNGPRRITKKEEEPAQEKRKNGRRTGPAEENINGRRNGPERQRTREGGQKERKQKER
jgi:hypothetical protein